MEVVELENEEEAADRAGEELNSIFSKNEGKHILFISSGGSSLKLVDTIQKEYINPFLTVAMTDERYSEDSSINNFAQLIETEFAGIATKQGVKWIDTRVQGRTLQELARDFESELRTWKESNPDGIIVMTQGMGPDGHTCGIMPYPENRESFATLFEDSERWVRGYDARNKNEFSERITITLPFLREMVHYSIVYIVGEEKRAAFEKVELEKGELYITPARIMSQMKQVTIYTSL
jgi:6-phosphogluconolactonase/glucosamine-6-phosphate isomerase/deaminase